MFQKKMYLNLKNSQILNSPCITFLIFIFKKSWIIKIQEYCKLYNPNLIGHERAHRIADVVEVVEGAERVVAGRAADDYDETHW